MDMDVDMDAPYNVSAFLIWSGKYQTYIFTPNADDWITPIPGFRMDISVNSTTAFLDTVDTS